jgi:NADPH-dependent ferric siderophore reductase
VAVRREPPAFRRAAVQAVVPRSPRLLRVTLAGPGLVGFTVDEPAASVRVLLPSDGHDDLVIPTWNGNQFLLPDGSRPALRTLTPRRVDGERGELDVEIVVHNDGHASRWASSAPPGAPVAISGPARGYVVDPDTRSYLLAGDETAIPAISQLLEALPDHARVDVHVEVAEPTGRVDLPPHPGAVVRWLDAVPGAVPGAALVESVVAAAIDPDTAVWAAGEAAAVQRIRRHLFDGLGLPRSQATVRGYWKHGRAGGSPELA